MKAVRTIFHIALVLIGTALIGVSLVTILALWYFDRTLTEDWEDGNKLIMTCDIPDTGETFRLYHRYDFAAPDGEWWITYQSDNEDDEIIVVETFGWPMLGHVECEEDAILLLSSSSTTLRRIYLESIRNEFTTAPLHYYKGEISHVERASAGDPPYLWVFYIPFIVVALIGVIVLVIGIRPL